MSPAVDEDALADQDAEWLRKRTCDDEINRRYHRIADRLQSLQASIRVMREALTRIAALEPYTLWGTRDRYTGERPEEQALCPSEVREIADAALSQQGGDHG